jgi:hypothetical protein
VNPGETVVTDGQLRVVPNGQVDIKTAGAPQGGSQGGAQASK